MTLDILIVRINMTYFVNVSKDDTADFTKTTKSVLKFHPE